MSPAFARPVKYHFGKYVLDSHDPSARYKEMAITGGVTGGGHIHEMNVEGEKSAVLEQSFSAALMIPYG